MQNAKKNYYLEFLKDYHSIKGTCKNDELPKLLLHVCCGACSSFPLPFFVDLFDITIYFTNSNIYPAEEFNLRLSELKRYVKFINEKINTKIKIVTDEYNYENFKMDLISFKDEKEGGRRCKICIYKRLKRTFDYALNNGFIFVSSIMTVSRNKDVDYINEVGELINKEYPSLKFIHSDLKKNNGQDIGVEISKLFGIYRQDYCGCEFSFLNK